MYFVFSFPVSHFPHSPIVTIPISVFPFPTVPESFAFFIIQNVDFSLSSTHLKPCK